MMCEDFDTKHQKERKKIWTVLALRYQKHLYGIQVPSEKHDRFRFLYKCATINK
jgi:hypothetical protein